MKYLIANWKAELSSSDVHVWIDKFDALLKGENIIQKALTDKTISIIICPSFPHIRMTQEALEKYAICVGAQDISAHTKGKYTGEVTGTQLSTMVQFVIVGHSERRTYEHESEEYIKAKLVQGHAAGLKNILCIRGSADIIQPQADIIAYEPSASIGTGKNENPEMVVAIKKQLNLPSTIPFLYGGSVTAENISNYLATGEIDGFLVGTASLNADIFLQLARQLCKKSSDKQ